MPEERTRTQMIAEAEVALRHAKRFRDAATMIDDDVVSTALRARATELESLAQVLEAQAGHLPNRGR